MCAGWCSKPAHRSRRLASGSRADFAGIHGNESSEINARYPHLKGRSLKSVILKPTESGPRGSADSPGDGALFCWDGLHSLDHEWATTGALRELTDLTLEEADPEADRQRD